MESDIPPPFEMTEKFESVDDLPELFPSCDDKLNDFHSFERVDQLNDFQNDKQSKGMHEMKDEFPIDSTSDQQNFNQKTGVSQYHSESEDSKEDIVKKEQSTENSIPKIEASSDINAKNDNNEVASNANTEELYKVGSQCEVMGWDDVYHPAKIIERRLGQKLSFEYYIHYIGRDRRLDEWVDTKRIKGVMMTQPKEMDRKRGHSHMKQKESYDNILEREHVTLTKVKYIKCIQFGKFEIDTWYFSPFPIVCDKTQKLWICEYCLKYMTLKKTYRYHLGECIARQPPGREIYYRGNLSLFEVDGLLHKLYAQNLCLMAKLFLDHKTLYFDVAPFFFYVLCSVDRHGSHIIGYFSKEKKSLDGNNLSCILVLPQYQRQGYGKLLISFSYELTKLEGVVGGPEKPLSDLGKLSYQSYWAWVLLDILKDARGVFSWKTLSSMTGIAQEDIISTLQSLKILKYFGRNGACITPEMIQRCIDSPLYKVPKIKVDPLCLKWMPTASPNI